MHTRLSGESRTDSTFKLPNSRSVSIYMQSVAAQILFGVIAAIDDTIFFEALSCKMLKACIVCCHDISTKHMHMLSFYDNV